MSNTVPEGDDRLPDFLDEDARKETHDKMKALLERRATRINETLEEVDGHTNVPYGKEFIERWGK